MEIIRGNYGYDISLTIRDADQNVVDLTGVTKVLLNIANLENNRNVLSAECLEDDFANGKVKYTVLSDDILFKEGLYQGALQLQYVGKVVDTKRFHVTVKEKISL